MEGLASPFGPAGGLVALSAIDWRRLEFLEDRPIFDLEPTEKLNGVMPGAFAPYNVVRTGILPVMLYSVSQSISAALHSAAETVLEPGGGRMQAGAASSRPHPQP